MRLPELTCAELTVLGLIAEQPRHGYDLEQEIKRRGVRQWADIAFSSIYYVLAKLERKGLLVAEPGQTGPTSRRVLRVTPQGRRVAAEEALAYVLDARPAPQPVLVGLANLSLFEGDYEDALRSRLAALDSRIADVKEAERVQAPLPRAGREVFSFSLCLLEAERAWLAERVAAADV